MPTTRFAPSPTGHLHLGHACSALAGWRAARADGGRFLLRIEDIDQSRCRPEFEADLIEDLRWLELDWDGPIRRQSDHLDDYRAALARLREIG
ncbi:tRNA glutamyl-Q(34) synthetase GluQRS, partial [bacterium]|nr:tRNA glutamyl-Q(34) synthetase GluQRS [bacterium]